ncbi:MAG: lipoyl(octanoyl) transferase LipB [Bacteroidota bacterium]
MNTLYVSNLGRTHYADAWTLQRKLFNLRHRELIYDVLLFTEHEHVYTIGKGGDENHLLASGDELLADGTEVFRIDRGGDITYHGPGQVVGYPIINLNQHSPDIHRYLRSLEEAIILSLGQFGIEGGREEGMTGVWVRGEKIAAIGVKVSKWITMHGFALNVNTDLKKFERIIPCGIFHKGVTSMQKILAREIPLDEVRDSLTKSFCAVFGCTAAPIQPALLHQRIEALQVESS